MDSHRIRIGERILLTLWVGGLWVIGYVVAPVLFSSLEDRSLAGTLAGQLFRIIGFIGLVCGSLLLAGNQMRNAASRRNPHAVVLVIMLLLIAFGQFVLTPMIAEMREASMTDSARFATLHGVASFAYLITSLLGLFLVASRDTS